MVRPQPKLPTETDRQLFRRNLPVQVLLALWLLGNVCFTWATISINPNYPAVLLTAGIYGMVGSQIVMCAFLLALFPASILFRVLVVTTAIAAFCSSLLFGAGVFGGYWVIGFFGLNAIPITVLALAVPFLLARHFLGWRLEFDWIESPDHMNLSVSGLLIATALVALAIALLGYGKEQELMLRLAFAGGCMGASFAIIVPLTYLVMMARRKWIWISVFAIPPIPIAYAIMPLMKTDLSIPSPGWGVVGIGLAVSLLILSFASGLVVLGHCGGTLKTSRTG